MTRSRWQGLAFAALAALAGCHLIGGAYELEFVDSAAGGTSTSSNGGAAQGGMAGAGGAGGSVISCTSPDDCGGGPCVDGYCCDDACDGECVACNVSGLEGTCSPTPPAEETCGAAGICDGRGDCVIGQPGWLRIEGDPSSQRALNMALSPTGVVVGGYFNGNMLLGTSYPLSELASSDVDGFVMALSESNALEWAVGFGSATHTQEIAGVESVSGATFVAADCYDNVAFRVGSGPTTFGPRNCGTSNDLYVARIDPNAPNVVDKVVAGPYNFGSGASDVALNGTARHPSNGNVAVALAFHAPMPVSMGQTFTPTGADGAVLVFSSSLSLSWDKQIGGSGSEAATAVVYRPDGDLIVAGNYTGTFSLDASVTPPPMGFGAYVVRLSAVAPHDVVWAIGFGNDQPQYISDLDIDADGNVLLSMVARGAYSVDGVDINGGLKGQGALLALDGDDGSALWAKVLASNDLSALFTTAVTPGGNIAIGGSFRGTMELAKVHSANAATHAYVALLAYDGTPLWSHAGGGSNSGDSAEIRALVTDADGKVYAAGSTTTGLSFDNVSQPGKGGGNDAWVAQFVK